MSYISAAEMNILSDSLGVSAARALSVSDTLKLHGVLEAPADSSHSVDVRAAPPPVRQLANIRRVTTGRAPHLDCEHLDGRCRDCINDADGSSVNTSL